MEGDSGMVIDVEGVWILDGMGMFSCMRAGIGVAVCVLVLVVVVVVVVLVVLLVWELLTLWLVVVVVVLAVLVAVATVREEGVLVEFGCVLWVLSGLSGGGFVVVVVVVWEDLGLVLWSDWRMALWCWNGRGDFLRRFSLKSVAGNTFVGACLFGMVMCDDGFFDFLDFLCFLELLEVGMLVWCRWRELWGWAWEEVVLVQTWVVGVMAWVVEVVRCWLVAGSPGFVESSGKTSHTVSHSFSISAAIYFWSAWKGEVVIVVEVLTNECVEVWKRLRLGTYSQEGLVSESKKRMLCENGICCHYRVWKVD